MSEEDLRVEACEWLKRHYPLRSYHLEPMVFHGISLTITQFLHRKFKGEQLVCIPRYNDLAIRPDVIGVTKFPKNEGYTMGWIVGECKVGRPNASDFRQAVHYANVTGAYEAYMFYEGTLSREVLDSINTGGHLYSGTNKWGRTVKKRLLFVEHEDDRLIKKIF